MMKKSFSKTEEAIVLVPNTTDGFFTELAIKKHLIKQGVKPITVRVYPYQLGRTKLADDLLVYTGGFGKKNCMINVLNTFIDKFSNRIVFWADNHPGSDCIHKEVGKSHYNHGCIEKYPTCISLLKEIWGSSVIKEEWVEAALFLETKTGTENIIAETYKKILYVGRVKDQSGQGESGFTEQIKNIYADFLVSEKNEIPEEISLLLREYDSICQNTKEAIDSLHWSEDFPNLVTIAKAEGEVDKDLIRSAVESSKHLLVIQNKDEWGNEVTTMIAPKPEMIPAKYQKNCATCAFITGEHKIVWEEIKINLIPMSPEPTTKIANR